MTMELKCDCGGVLKRARLGGVDLTEELGLKVTLEEVDGLRCDRCAWETLRGETIDLATHVVAAVILDVEERLPAAYARYLRKYLGLTQAELAERMGLTRKTVNQWETGDPISPQNDLVLRALGYARLPDSVRTGPSMLDHVRTAPPKLRPPRLVVKRLGRAA